MRRITPLTCTAGSIVTKDGLIPVIVDCGSETCSTSTFYKK